MGRQARASTSPNVPIKWSKKFYKYALEKNFFARSGLIGEGEDSMIRVHKDLTKEKGNTIRMPMTGPLTGIGGGDDFNSEDILEAYSIYHFDIVAHERGHATGVSGPYTQQLMIEDWPKEATNKIASWKGVTMELETINALCGLYNLSDDVQSVNENAPSSDRIAYGGEAADGTLGVKSSLGDDTDLGTTAAGVTDDYELSGEAAASYMMGPTFLEAVVDYYINQEPRPQMLMIEGKPCLILLMTTGQARNFVQNAKYIARNQYAQVRGSKNPLLNDSLGFWNCGEVSVLLKSYGRMPYRIGAGGTTPQESFELSDDRSTAATLKQVQTDKTVGRALLMGAQAGGIAYGSVGKGQMFNRFEGDLDSGTKRKPFMGVDWIYGISKTVFENESNVAQSDYGLMCLDTMQV